jgi:outer membrane biogenesis lipoprotein LolB
MRLTVILILTLLSGCAGLKPDQASNRTGSLLIQEHETLHQQAREAAQQSRERYVATTQPALQRKFRQEYPAMTDADLDLLVNDALEKGLRTEAGHRPDGPIRQREEVIRDRNS